MKECVHACLCVCVCACVHACGVCVRVNTDHSSTESMYPAWRLNSIHY